MFKIRVEKQDSTWKKNKAGFKKFFKTIKTKQLLRRINEKKTDFFSNYPPIYL